MLNQEKRQTSKKPILFRLRKLNVFSKLSSELKFAIKTKHPSTVSTITGEPNCGESMWKLFPREAKFMEFQICMEEEEKVNNALSVSQMNPMY